MAQPIDVATYAQIKLDNNKNGVVGALRAAGYNTKYDAADKIILQDLMAFYKANPAGFFASLDRVKYNPDANNYTTSDAFKARIIEFVNTQTGSTSTGKVDFAGWSSIFGSLGGLLSGTVTTITQPTLITTTTPVSGGKTGLVVGLIFIVLAIIGLVAWIFLRK